MCTQPLLTIGNLSRNGYYQRFHEKLLKLCALVNELLLKTYQYYCWKIKQSILIKGPVLNAVDIPFSESSESTSLHIRYFKQDLVFVQGCLHVVCIPNKQTIQYRKTKLHDTERYLPAIPIAVYASYFS